MCVFYLYCYYTIITHHNRQQIKIIYYNCMYIKQRILFPPSVLKTSFSEYAERFIRYYSRELSHFYGYILLLLYYKL